MESFARLLQLNFSLFLLLQFIFPFSLCSPPQRHLLQSTSPPPQNLQTFPSTAIPAFTNPPPPPPPPQLTPPTPPSQVSTAEDCGARKIAVAVVASAASSFALSALFFFAFHRFSKQNRRKLTPPRVHNSAAVAVISSDPLRSKPEATLNGAIVDNGLDVLYWRNLGDAALPRCNLCNGVIRGSGIEEKESPPSEKKRRREGRRDHELPLLPSGSVNSSSRVFDQPRTSNWNSSASVDGVEEASHVTATPPPKPPTKSQPPPPPAPVINKGPAPPPPPPMRRGMEAPPPPVPTAPSSMPMPIPVPVGGREPPRLKQLYWDKVTPVNAGHSVVWDRIKNGSIKFDDDLMESLFGYFSVNKNPPNLQPGESTTSGAAAPASSFAQIRLLDARKSQNIAIILRTLSISRQEILDSLRNGHGLAADTFEKLSRIALSNDEEFLILNFSGDPSKLVDAESFLFHLLRAVPSAFARIAAMHFRHSLYIPEILHLKQSLQTLELACKELRTRGLLLKLLEAILKAGNRMNAGTSRGNAQAFDLTALRKLSDVKSTDGNTTLLHFVVEEVVRSEGKHCAAVNRSLSLRRSASRNSGSAAEQEAREEREREYLMLGLPVVGGLSVEFTNVKKAAALLDHELLAGSCAALAARVVEIQRFLVSLEEDGGFVREMRGFAEAAAGEIEAVKEEHGRVMEIVERTTEYYQPGAAASKKVAQSLQLFVIVRDFLAMVDQACIDITRNLQKKKQRKTQPFFATANRRADSAAPVVVTEEEEKRITTRFPNLPPRFMTDNSVSSSDSEC